MRRQREWTAICATQIHAPQNVSFAHTPGPQLSLPAHNSLGTAASILARHRCYDDFELYDVHLSRLVIETLVHPTLRATITTRYGHFDDFDDLPGSVYFQFALDAVHASTSLDISKAASALKSLSLASFPGQNINDFSTAALKQVKIMQLGWAIPYTGSSIIAKITNNG